MDKKTGEQLALLRDTEDTVRASYASASPAKSSGRAYIDRFRDIGARVVTEDSRVTDTPADGRFDGYIRRTYERTTHFSERLLLDLIAQTMLDASSVEALTSVCAIIRREGVDSDLVQPLAIESLSTADFESPSNPLEAWNKLRAMEQTLDTADGFEPAAMDT